MRIDKYPYIEGVCDKCNNKIITILSIVTSRWETKGEGIIKTLLEDKVFYGMGSYWAIHNEDTEEGYNCCEAFNKATDLCNSDIMIYTTGDGLIEPQLLWRAYGELLIHNLPVFAYRMDEGEDRSWKENNDSLGDFIMVRREWALTIGGWDCRMKDWGFMDYDFLGRMSLLLQKDYFKLGLLLGKGLADRVKHFYHPRRTDEWYREQNKKNRLIVEEQGLWTRESYEELVCRG